MLDDHEAASPAAPSAPPTAPALEKQPV
jgi:hypothetical protein